MTIRSVPRLLSLLAAAAALFSCAAPQRPATTPLPDDLAVAEAVFRHLRAHNSSGQQKKAEVFFLELRGGDPPACLLERFAGEKPPVLPASAADRSSGIVNDPGTGARGLVLQVKSIGFPAPDRARVEGGFYEAPLSAAGSIYLLDRKGGSWQVVEEQRIWISSRPRQQRPAFSAR
jgi:hypothetical protein